MPCSVATSLCNSSSVAASHATAPAPQSDPARVQWQWERQHMVVIQYCSFLFRLARVLLP
ncbi:hypothetical protein SESBI_28576 [Sesbania bispinosa]|nr:hypothetical protein SESBI_28576 [Sesbania bispinosa]